jgi:GTPase SAR1 family protein
MQTELERRRLAEFVDRTEEMERFRRMLDSDEKHVMIVWGDAGMGKTSLRLRMVHECAQRKLRKAEVECGGTRTTSYLAIMRKIRDDTGLAYFNPFSDYVNFLTDPNYQPKVSLDINVQAPGGITVAQRAEISGANVGDIAGVVIKDNMLVLPRNDIAVPEEERMMRLTDRFIEGLKTALNDGKLVVFLDAVEKMPPDTTRWLWEEPLLALREGRLTGIKFVLCGEQRPQLDRDWRMFIEEAELHPLALEHIEAYLEKRGVQQGLCNGLAMYLLANTKGKISLIAEGVDAFLALQQNMPTR